MTTKLTLSAMMAGLNDLTAQELRELNTRLVAVCNQKARADRMVKAATVVDKFQIGDVISFFKPGRGKNAGLNFFIYENLNRAGDCMQGPSCDSKGVRDVITTKWTVSLTSSTVKVALRNGKPV